MQVRSKKKFYPVIYCVDPYKCYGIGYAINNTRAAIENGADGVFLIGHNINYLGLTYIYREVRKQFPNIWIGINLLDISADQKPERLEAILLAQDRVDAVWTDQIPSKKLNFFSETKVFGTISFSYSDTRQTADDLSMYCKRATKFVNVATSIGNKTGEPPDIEKLRSMHTLIDGAVPIALVGGVTEHNIVQLLPYVDYFLVTPSYNRIESSFDGNDHLIPKKVIKLADIIHG